MPFSKLSLPLQQALVEARFSTATPIQEKVIPLVLERKDIMARAQTGSGKSASFVLPILELWSASKNEGKAKIKALILTPTRELTVQVAEAFTSFGKCLHVKPKVVSIIGGEKIGEQLYDIQQGCDIVVATSGRLLDIMSKKQIDLSRVEFFALMKRIRCLTLVLSRSYVLFSKHCQKNAKIFSFPQPILKRCKPSLLR